MNADIQRSAILVFSVALGSLLICCGQGEIAGGGGDLAANAAGEDLVTSCGTNNADAQWCWSFTFNFSSNGIEVGEDITGYIGEPGTVLERIACEITGTDLITLQVSNGPALEGYYPQSSYANCGWAHVGHAIKVPGTPECGNDQSKAADFFLEMTRGPESGTVKCIASGSNGT